MVHDATNTYRSQNLGECTSDVSVGQLAIGSRLLLLHARLDEVKGQRQERGEESCDELRANIGGQAVAGQLLELFQGCLDAAAPQVREQHENKLGFPTTYESHSQNTIATDRNPGWEA